MKKSLYKNAKNFFGFLLCMTIVLSSFSPLAAEVTAIEEAEEKITGYGSEKLLKEIMEPIIYEDYNNYNYSFGSYDGFDFIRGGKVGPYSDGDDHGSYVSIATSASCEPYHELKEPLTKGVYVFSFDVKKRKAGGHFYITTPLVAETHTGELAEQSHIFTIRNNKLGYYAGSRGWSDTPVIACENNTWYHVMLWLDFDNKKIHYYFDNEKVGESPILGDAYAFRYNCTMNDATNPLSLDNIALFEVVPEMYKVLSDAGINAPADMLSELQMGISSKKTGNIFASFDEVELTASYKNRTDKVVEFDAEYTAFDHRGNVAWSDKREGIKVEAEEAFIDVLHPELDKYDIYTFKYSYKIKDGTEISLSDDVEFSVVNAPTPGYQNPRMGTNVDPQTRNADINKYFDVLKNTGYSVLRGGNGLQWKYWETGKKGNYALDAWGAQCVNVQTSISDAGYEPLLIWGTRYGMPLYGPATGVSTDPEYLQGLEKAAEAFAKKYKDQIRYFELDNEPNYRESYISAPDYGKVAHAFAKGIKSGNPDAVVMIGGLSRISEDWIHKMLESAGGIEYIDAISMHPYIGAYAVEVQNWEREVRRLRESFDKKGWNDLKIWITETGITTVPKGEYTSFQGQGVKLVRTHITNAAYDCAECIVDFCLEQPETNPNSIESWFGIIHGAHVKNAYGAKPAYMMISNFNAMTENSEVDEKIVEDDIYIYRFKRADGKCTLAMYCDQGVKSVTLDLGDKSGTLYDMYGNPTALKSDNGKYTFVLSDIPAYFEYSGKSLEKCAESKDVVWQQSSADNRVEYSITIPSGAVAEVKAHDNLEIEKSVKNGKLNLKVSVKEIPEKFDYTDFIHDFGTKLMRDDIVVTFKKNGKTVSRLPLALDYFNYSANVQMTLHPYDNDSTKYWVGKIKVTSNKDEGKLKGEIIIDGPEKLAKTTKPIKVEDIKPGESKEYKINIPPELSTTDQTLQLFEGRLVLDTGEEIHFEVGDVVESYHYKEGGYGTRLMYLRKAKEETKIDGVIDEKEWKKYKLADFDKSQVSYGGGNAVVDGVVYENNFGADADYGGKADFSGSVYAKWDDEYLYMAAVVYDDVHSQIDDEIRSHMGDGFYVNTVPTRTQRHDTRIDMFLSTFYDDNKGRMFKHWSPIKGHPYYGDVLEDCEDAAVEVIRKDNVTIYEGRIPMGAVIQPEAFESKNFQMTFAIRDYDNDRDKSWSIGGWYSLID